MRILFPDAQFRGEPEVERAAAGPEVALDIYRERQADRIPDAVWGDCDGVLVYHEVAITPAVVERMRRCRIVVRSGVGYDQIDLAACGRRGIAVCNVPDYGTTEVADHAIALMLALTRGVVRYDQALRQDVIGEWKYDLAPLVRRHGTQTFGVFGLGRIGTAAALRARAFGMRVVFHDPYRATGTELALGFERVDTLEALCAVSDVLSIHTPLTPETRNAIGPGAIAALKPGAVIVNTARGGVVDLDALHEGLRSGRVAGAALDVVPEEPPFSGHPLIAAWQAREPWLEGRFVLTPHAAFYSPDSLTDMRRKGIETIMLYLTQDRLRCCVNLDHLPPEIRAKASA